MESFGAGAGRVYGGESKAHDAGVCGQKRTERGREAGKGENGAAAPFKTTGALGASERRAGASHSRLLLLVSAQDRPFEDCRNQEGRFALPVSRLVCLCFVKRAAAKSKTFFGTAVRRLAKSHASPVLFTCSGLKSRLHPHGAPACCQFFAGVTIH